MKKITPKNIENILLLTPLQEGMLFHYLKDPRSDLYFEQLSLEISGSIDAAFFEKAWNVVIQCNEMLRTVFRWEKLEKPSQVILREHPCQIKFHDFSDIDDRQKKTALAKVKKDDREEGFDLTRVPFRVTLCKLAETQYEMIISNHHILYDGWSYGIILKEFFETYHLICQGEQLLKFPCKPSFKEFIRWLQHLDKNKQKQYWYNYLAGFETAVDLPIKRKKEGITGVGEYSTILEMDIQNKLDIFVKHNRVTLASVFYSAWGILLQKYCGSEDVVFGTTVSGRSANLKGIEDMVGLFINTIPLRFDTRPDEKIINAVIKTDQTLREREAFESTPLVDIAGRDVARNVSTLAGGELLFDNILVIENYPLDNHLVPDDSLLSIHSYSMVETTNYELSVGIMPFKEIEINFSFKQELFEKEAIENLAVHFKIIIRHIIENPGMVLLELETIPIEEKNRILHEFNNTAVEYPSDKTIHQLFEEQALKTPDHIAVFGHGQTRTNTDNNYVGADLCVCPVSLTYRQLNQQSDQLAGLLIEKGIQPDTIVAIKMERSIEMIIGILGILKSGGAYLPIDPEYPQERIDYMLKDSGAKLLAGANDQEGEKVRRWEGEPSYLLNSSNLAYIIYTSGSTGKPKGVMVEHRSVVNVIWCFVDRYGIGIGTHLVQMYNYTFDPSVSQIFGALIRGAGLHLISKELLVDMELLRYYIERHQICMIDFLPRVLHQLLGEEAKLKCLKTVLCGGEKLDDYIKDALLDKGYEVFNHYGPTETTIDVSAMECLKSMPGNIIGKPINNVRCYILEKDSRLAPIGVSGELWVAGSGVARGYLNNPELTGQKFKFNRSSRSYKTYILYKTGDLARWLPAGSIEFLGRIDQQVKIRGFRIELGEIENLLLKHPVIKEAVVSVQGEDSGDKYLCAYVATESEKVIEKVIFELREFLSNKLPDYMIPSYFVPIEKIPLTPNGKIDWRTLPRPELKINENYTPPRNEIEKKLVEIWSSVLGVEKKTISIDVNFFDLGGHSLKATILRSKIHQSLDIEFPISELFKRPTIEKISEYIKNIKGLPVSKYTDLDKVEKKEYYELSSAQKRLFILDKAEAAINTAYNLPGVMLIEGEPDIRRFTDTFNALLKRHDGFRASFDIKLGKPVQIVHDTVAFEIKYSTLEGVLPGIETVYPYSRKASELNQIIKDFIKPFDLKRAPLLRAALINLGSKKNLLLFDMHHIISDGVSIGILVRDFVALYEGNILPELKLQYNDFVAWQNKLFNSKEMKSQETYWLNIFRGVIPVLNMPTDYPRQPVKNFEGNTIIYEINRQLTGRIKMVMLKTGTTLYMVLLAVFNILLSMYSGQDDIIVGCPTAGRNHADLQNIIGIFVNTLAMRNYPKRDKSAGDFLAEVKTNALQAFENQDYPFDELVNKLNILKDYSRNPIFDILFVSEKLDIPKLELKDLTFIPIEFENNAAHMDLVFYIAEVDEKIELRLEYATALFKQSGVEGMLNHYMEILNQVVNNINIKLEEIKISHDFLAPQSNILKENQDGFGF